MSTPEKNQNQPFSHEEFAFPWNPEEGIMPKRPKKMGNPKRPIRPRRIPRRR